MAGDGHKPRDTRCQSEYVVRKRNVPVKYIISERISTATWGAQTASCQQWPRFRDGKLYNSSAPEPDLCPYSSRKTMRLWSGTRPQATRQKRWSMHVWNKQSPCALANKSILSLIAKQMVGTILCLFNSTVPTQLIELIGRIKSLENNTTWQHVRPFECSLASSHICSVEGVLELRVMIFDMMIVWCAMCFCVKIMQMSVLKLVWATY